MGNSNNIPDLNEYLSVEELRVRKIESGITLLQTLIDKWFQMIYSIGNSELRDLIEPDIETRVYVRSSFKYHCWIIIKSGHMGKKTRKLLRLYLKEIEYLSSVSASISLDWENMKIRTVGRQMLIGIPLYIFTHNTFLSNPSNCYWVMGRLITDKFLLPLTKFIDLGMQNGINDVKLETQVKNRKVTGSLLIIYKVLPFYRDFCPGGYCSQNKEYQSEQNKIFSLLEDCNTISDQTCKISVRTEEKYHEETVQLILIWSVSAM